ncbi:unnamed protein product [Linum tenue]|uniref:Uncharacterized protein n=1 Tax=Linum tenue TaxID=586396 RepID=A0AAV0IHD7_9ROSI|nr:unnamed protein product [Linum tenue]
MASSKGALFLLLILCSFLITRQFQFHAAVVDDAGKIDCKGKCKYRCSKASRHKICIRACNTCCHRCNCVPPGTSGNYDTCPCYYHMTTHGGRRKCP